MTNDGSPNHPATAVDGSRTVMVEVPTDLRRHPFRGLAWGFLGGLGLALVLIVTKVIELAIVPLVLVIVAVMVLGCLWGILAPPKPPSGPVPVEVTPGPQPTATRFDDRNGTYASGAVTTESGNPGWDPKPSPPPPPPPPPTAEAPSGPADTADTDDTTDDEPRPQ